MHQITFPTYLQESWSHEDIQLDVGEKPLHGYTLDKKA
jgi:hypothetical protein